MMTGVQENDEPTMNVQENGKGRTRRVDFGYLHKRGPYKWIYYLHTDKFVQ